MSLPVADLIGLIFVCDFEISGIALWRSSKIAWASLAMTPSFPSEARGSQLDRSLSRPSQAMTPPETAKEPISVEGP